MRCFYVDRATGFITGEFAGSEDDALLNLPEGHDLEPWEKGVNLRLHMRRQGTRGRKWVQRPEAPRNWRRDRATQMPSWNDQAAFLTDAICELMATPEGRGLFSEKTLRAGDELAARIAAVKASNPKPTT